MQRQIKFRGKTEAGEWVYGNLVTTKFESFIIDIPFLPVISVPSGRFIEVIPDSVGQFAGIIDASGLNIYEGDIVNHPDFANGCNLLIGFHDGYFHGSNWGPERTDFTNSIIIGNATDNPDLLS